MPENCGNTGNTSNSDQDGQDAASGNALEHVLRLIARMRTPGTGEPWAIRQDMPGIVPYTIEESYEIAEAVDHGDIDAIRSELGDLLLQVVFYAQIAKEQGWFDFNQVALGLGQKLQQRYYSRMPGGGSYTGKRPVSRPGDTLAGVSHAMPAARRAEKLQLKAAKTGFDWPGPEAVASRIQEELDELQQELEAGKITAAREELGDVLFICVNLARHLGSDTDTILRTANRKFERRFAAMERKLKEAGTSLDKATMEQMEQAWQQAKAEERNGSADNAGNNASD